MIEAAAFVEAAFARGLSLYTGVPCSYFTPLINYAIDAPALAYLGAANEGDAVAIAAGAELGGRRGVVMMQNSGLGNAVSPLASLTHVFRIPMLLVVTLRGEPGGAPDEPQHALMGRVTTDMLDLLEIPWARFPDAAERIAPVLERACAHMDAAGRPFALVMSKGTVAPYALRARPAPPRRPAPAVPPPSPTDRLPSRAEALGAVQSAVSADDLVLATTGYTGRELYALDDRPNQLYMVGSMGCVSSLALGLALTRPERRVVAIDGDGAALMRLGAMTTVGHAQPPNLEHVLLDNGVHESTGGQATASASVDFCAMAAASGYARVVRARTPEELARALAARADGPGFVHLAIRPGTLEALPRPSVTPAEVAARFRRHVRTAA